MASYLERMVGACSTNDHVMFAIGINTILDTD